MNENVSFDKTNTAFIVHDNHHFSKLKKYVLVAFQTEISLQLKCMEALMVAVWCNEENAETGKSIVVSYAYVPSPI